MVRTSVPHEEFIEVEGLPDEPAKPKSSRSVRAWIAAQRAASKHVKAEHGTEAEAERFYRAVLQWKRRNPERSIAAKRVGTDVYVWIPESQTFGPFPVPKDFRD